MTDDLIITFADGSTRKLKPKIDFGELANSPIYDLLIAHSEELEWQMGNDILGPLATTAVYEALGNGPLWQALTESTSDMCRVVKSGQVLWLEVTATTSNKDVGLHLLIEGIRPDLLEALVWAMRGKVEAGVHLKPALRLVNQNEGKGLE